MIYRFLPPEVVAEVQELGEELGTDDKLALIVVWLVRNVWSLRCSRS